MHDVAEIDDARHQPGVVEQHVVEGEVAVHDLRAKLRIARPHALVEPVEDPVDLRLPRGLGD